MVVKELLRLSDGPAKGPFCWFDISKIQLKSNWTVGEGHLTSDQSQFDNAAQGYLNNIESFYNA